MVKAQREKIENSYGGSPIKMIVVPSNLLNQEENRIEENYNVEEVSCYENKEITLRDKRLFS